MFLARACADVHAHASQLQYTNESIKGAYAVDIGENKSGPDVHFKSTNGAIRVSLWLRGTVPRPAEVQLESKNGSVKATLAVRDDGQPLLVRATSTNGELGWGGCKARGRES